MRSGRRRALVAASLVTALAALAGVVLQATSGPGSQPRARSADPRATATVTRETLREFKIVSGTFGTSPPVTLAYRTEEQAAVTLTEVPRAGTVVGRGDVLFRANQQPVILLFGNIPAWRTMKHKVRGRDVLQLQENLAALGHLQLAWRGHFDLDTKAAVERWQEATGQRTTGKVKLGSVVFADGPRRIAPGGSPVGTVLSNGTGAVEVTTLRRSVRVKLAPGERELAAVGRRVRVTLPDQSTVRGRVVSVGVAAAPEGGGGAAELGGAEPEGGGEGAGQAAFEALVDLGRGKRVRALPDGVTVSVALTRRVRRKTLTVPVTALVARLGGGYAVRVIRAGGSVAVPVRVGMFADGLAEVCGAIREGDRVEVPEL